MVRAHGPDKLYVSVITLGEIRAGIEALPSGKRRSDLEHWLQQGLPAWFEGNLSPIAKDIADLWGKLTIQAKRQGASLHTADGLIAATALRHRLTLVTRNVKDFTGLNVPTFNPFNPVS